jgi:hypothetical protein
MMQIARAIGAAMLGLYLSFSNAAADSFWKEVRGWRVVFSNEYVGCIATADYRDGTRIRIGFDGVIREPFINFSNRAWSSYATGVTHEITFEAGRGGRFSGYFHTLLRDGVLTFENGGVNGRFLDAFASASAMKIRHEDRLLTGLVLDGSRAALDTVLACQRGR